MSYISTLSCLSPSLARGAEIALYAGVLYILQALTTGQVINLDALLVAVGTPLCAMIAKHLRDIEKQYAEEYQIALQDPLFTITQPAGPKQNESESSS